MARVLICDDAMFMRQTLIRMIEADGNSVAGQAANGEESIEQYKACKPDIVLMDITMPDMNGIEATKKIIEFDPNAKIIMVSAMGQKASVFEAIGAGAKDFIVKPCTQEKVTETIRRYL